MAMKEFSRADASSFAVGEEMRGVRAWARRGFGGVLGLIWGGWQGFSGVFGGILRGFEYL
jgi:hypothetical protein